MKIAFPLPLLYERPEQRFLLRDGARFAEVSRERGHDAVKLLLGDPVRDQPESPLLRVASQEQWNSPDWWRSEAYDLVVMFGRPWRAIQAIRSGSQRTRLLLKMDSGYGLSSSWFPRMELVARRYAFTRYVQERPPMAALLHALFQVVRETSPAAIRRTIQRHSLLDGLLYETPFAAQETREWFQRHGTPGLAERVHEVAHPVPDSFAPRGTECRKAHSVIAVANWKRRYKGAPLLVATLQRLFATDVQATATLIGTGSSELRNSFAADASRIKAFDSLSPSEVRESLLSSQVYLGTSLCESFHIAVAEALCCGCSVALAPGIGVPSYRFFVQNGSGILAANRAPESMASAIADEFVRWDSDASHFDTTARLWGERCHTSALLRKMLEIKKGVEQGKVP